MEKKFIRDRLLNWSLWARQRTGGKLKCMTGVVCDSLRRNALGEVWSGHGTGPVVDPADAELVERAWKVLTPKHKALLLWTYIHGANPGFICRRLGIAARPASIFDLELNWAERAIDAALESLHDRSTSPQRA